MEIEFVADIKHISASLSDLNKRFADFSKQVGEPIEKTSQKINGLGGSFLKTGFIIQQSVYYVRAFTNALKGLIAESNAQEQALAALSNAMENTGRYSRAALQDLQDYAGALQKTTIYGDEQTLQAAAMLEAMTGLDNQGLKPLIKATMDLAAAKRMDLVSAADLVGKAIGSETNALSRFGISVEGAVNSQERLQSLLDSVNAKFKGQAEALAQTDAGKIIQMTNAVSDLKETIGDGIKIAFRPMAELLTAIAGSAESAGGTIRALTAHVVVAAAGIAALALKAKLGARALEMLKISSAGAIFTVRGLSTALKSLNAALGPVGWAIVGLTVAYETWMAIKSRNIRKTQEEIDKQKELKAEVDGLIQSYDVGQIEAEIEARRQRLAILEKEGRQMRSGDAQIRQLIISTGRLKTEDELLAAAEQKQVEGRQAEREALQRELALLEGRLNYLRQAGILSEQEIAAREELARIEAKAAGQEIAWLKAKIAGMGEYKNLTAAQKVEYQKLRQEIEALGQADELRRRSLEEIRNSIEYQTVVEKKSLAEARKTASDYYKSRIEEAREAGDVETELRYRKALEQVWADKAEENRAKKSRDVQKTILAERIAAVRGTTAAEVNERERLKLELRRINNEISEDEYQLAKARLEIQSDAAQEWAAIYKKAQDDITGIITGGGFGAAYETVLERVRQKLIAWAADTLGITQAWAVAQVAIEEWMAKAKETIQNWLIARKSAQVVKEQGLDAKEIASNTAVATSEMAVAGAKTVETHAKIPFPVNIAIIGASMAGLIALMSSFKSKGQAIVRAAEGALIDRPTLVLAGEAIARSGREMVLPLFRTVMGCSWYVSNVFRICHRYLSLPPFFKPSSL